MSSRSIGPEDKYGAINATPLTPTLRPSSIDQIVHQSTEYIYKCTLKVDSKGLFRPLYINHLRDAPRLMTDNYRNVERPNDQND